MIKSEVKNSIFCRQPDVCHHELDVVAVTQTTNWVRQDTAV